jgi:hypothetical protein
VAFYRLGILPLFRLEAVDRFQRWIWRELWRDVAEVKLVDMDMMLLDDGDWICMAAVAGRMAAAAFLCLVLNGRLDIKVESSKTEFW